MKKFSPWQQTYTGKVIEYGNVDLDQIDIVDIAHSLSMQCRYGGHLEHFYSVAEHSWLVSHRVSKENAFWGLMHDAAEAYITDIPTPIKDYVPLIRPLEDYLLRRIAIKFNLWGLEIPKEVKNADLRLLMTEKHQFFDNVEPRDWEVSVKKYDGMIIPCYTPKIAERAFMQRFRELYG